MSRSDRRAWQGAWAHLWRQAKPSLYILVAFGLGLIMLVVLVASAIYLATWPYEGLNWSSSAQIVQVDPAGPAAGHFELGDVITSLEGVPLTQVTQLYMGKYPGDPVTFIVRRGGQEQSVIVILSRPTPLVVLSRLAPLLIALTFWAIGVLVLAFKTNDLTARLLYHIFSNASCGVLAFGALSNATMGWAGSLFYAFLWMLAPLVVHLHLSFPRTIALPRRRLIVAALYSLPAIASLSGLWGGMAWIRHNAWFRSAAYLYVSLSLAASVILLVQHYRGVASNQVHREIRMVGLGTGLGLLPTVFFVLLPGALRAQPLIPFNLAFFFLLAIPLSYGYGIVRFQLIQLDRYINRTLVYYIFIVLLVASFLLVDMVVEQLVSRTSQYRLGANLLLALFVVFAFAPLRDRLQRIVDWGFYGGWYDYRRAVQIVSQALDPVTDVETLAQVLPNTLKDVMKLRCACLMLYMQKDDTRLHSVTQPDCPVCCNSQLGVDPAGPLGQFLLQARKPVVCDLVRDSLVNLPLTLDEMQLLACSQKRLWVPLVGRDGLLGMLILGPKESDDQFNGEDLQILEVVARQASITVQNAALLFELQQRAADIERLHQQLLRAREEERKRLARELHDEIIQALVSLNYDISRLAAPRDKMPTGQVEHLQSQVHGVMGDLRRICSELRPPALDSLGLVSAIRSRLREMESEGTCKVELLVEGNEETSLSEELEVCLYRVLQEALANVQKHTQATRVSVKLMLGLTSVHLLVQDNGSGFVVPPHLSTFMDDGHFGLAGVRERLDLIGGKLTVRSIPGQGTCLEAWLSLLPATNMPERIGL